MLSDVAQIHPVTKGQPSFYPQQIRSEVYNALLNNFYLHNFVAVLCNLNKHFIDALQCKNIQQTLTNFTKPYGCIIMLEGDGAFHGRWFTRRINIWININVAQKLAINMTIIELKTVFIDLCPISEMLLWGLLMGGYRNSMSKVCKSEILPGDAMSIVSFHNWMTLHLGGIYRDIDQVSIHYESRKIIQNKNLILQGTHKNHNYSSHFRPMIQDTMGNAFETVLWFRLQGNFSQKVQVKFKNLCVDYMHIADGPGPKSPKLSPSITNNKFQIYTSTFSSLSFIMIGTLQYLNEKNITILYEVIFSKSRLRQLLLKIPNDIETITTNGIVRTIAGKYFLWIIKTHHENKVKFEIHKWKYKGPSDRNCSFGGLSVFSLNDNRSMNKSDINLCGKIANENYIKNLTIWSSSHIMGIEIRFYHPYSDGVLFGMVSSSSCIVSSNIYEKQYPPFAQVKAIHGRPWNRLYNLFEIRRTFQRPISCMVIQQLDGVHDFLDFIVENGSLFHHSK